MFDLAIVNKTCHHCYSWLARPQGGTLIFSHLRMLGLFFWVQNSEFQYFLGFQKKIIFFGGYEDIVDIFLGSSQNWASLRVISMQFRVLYLGKGTELG